MEAEKLKPCPFCGNPPSGYEAIGGQYVSCPGINGNLVGCCSPCVPVRDWNTRPLEDALQKENAALKEENERLKHSHDYLAQLTKDLLVEIEGLKAGPGTSLRDLM